MDTDTERISVESTLKELHAYAKLLFLRTGRQFQGKVSYQELEEDISPDECSNDGNSLNNAPLGNFDTDQLRRNFLDRLSETVSSMKGGRHVAASYMFYWPDKIKVFVAMNSGLLEGDTLSKFLDTLCTSLKTISVAPDNETEKHMDALWNMLLRHQSSRLQATIVDLRQIMKGLKDLLPQLPGSKSIGDGALADIDGIMLGFEGCLKVLAQLLFGDSDSNLERHNSLVTVSHAVYRTFPAEKFQALGRQGERLRQEIGFLGRLQTSLHVLVAAARQISGFDDLSLIPVVKPKIRKKPSGQEWNLARTFHALNIQLSNTAVEKLMQPSSSKIKWTKNKVITDFSRLKSPTWEIHAEVQLVAFTLSHPDEIANGKRFDYIGCSRYICLQCSKFLQCFPELKTRGSHGKLYNHSWTLPPGDSLGKDGQQALYAAAREVTSWMRKELLGSSIVTHHRKPEVKESTIGGSLMSVFETSQEGHQQSHAISEHLYRQRAEAFHGTSSHNRNFSSLPNSLQDEETSIVEVYDMTPAESAISSCTTCFDKTTRRCSYCRQGRFCNKRCERRMPLSHLLKCNMRQVTSADYLYQDVREDIIPTDSQVRQDYWFDRCQSSYEESHLAGLFAGLLRYHHFPITREELHQWKSDSGDNEYLVKRIVEKFEELPKGGTGRYFAWFLRHRNRFELPDGHESIPQRPSPEMQAKNMRDKAWKYLAPEDQNKDFEDLSPFAKMHCFAFYSITIESARRRCLGVGSLYLG
ncbi:hypothetical protein FVEG_10634 [Fusarium verticillioides 7600]|uniref:MYND-type domain-containing protein n=1 Tax=Gibberella moniliformis (strain M3125 / FGSC 7600) TaxID=334819 RepID=W7MVB9_GIBM7|nr:hypothetical protein FVEG_10634 [Fusarium verticillioides 7600]EWG51744.1 hypothetical protein FVEG_10634 [Fusarium verticillioides 7600]